MFFFPRPSADSALAEAFQPAKLRVSPGLTRLNHQESGLLLTLTMKNAGFWSLKKCGSAINDGLASKHLDVNIKQSSLTIKKGVKFEVRIGLTWFYMVCVCGLKGFNRFQHKKMEVLIIVLICFLVKDRWGRDLGNQSMQICFPRSILNGILKGATTFDAYLLLRVFWKKYIMSLLLLNKIQTIKQGFHPVFDQRPSRKPWAELAADKHSQMMWWNVSSQWIIWWSHIHSYTTLYIISYYMIIILLCDNHIIW